MVKEKFKTITAVRTIVNGHTEYISSHSIRFDGKYLPQFNQDPVHAKEFESDEIYLTNEEQATWYLTNVHNPYHRFYEVVNIEIPIILDLKKYDRDKKKEMQRLATPVIRNKVLTDALLTFFLFTFYFLISSCSKSQVTQPKQSYAVYQLIIEHYKIDTTFVQRYIQWQDTVFAKKEQLKIDTIHATWYLMCATDKLPLRLEYWYYTRNGIKIK